MIWKLCLLQPKKTVNVQDSYIIQKVSFDRSTEGEQPNKADLCEESVRETQQIAIIESVIILSQETAS